jgi:hypothetical protein
MYSDSLVQLTAESLVINHYYFPFVGKTILLEDIAVVNVVQSNFLRGQWKIWGMGLWPVWFAFDFNRPLRDAIFVVEIRNSWPAAGFTAESSQGVLRALEDRKVPVEIIE